MWEMTPETDPVVTGDVGLVKKTLRKYTSRIQGDINIHEVYKILPAQYTFTRGCNPSSEARAQPPRRASGPSGHSCKDM